MLIIGNGFDLAHGRPTKYEDFLKFAEQIIRTITYDGTKKQFESMMPELHAEVKKYVLTAFETRQKQKYEPATNKNAIIQELYDCLDKNVWYEYFQLIYKGNEIHGNNWIDFEGEIREVIEFFDREIDDLYEQLPASLTSFQSVPIKISCFSKKLDFSEYNQENKKGDSYKNTYYDLIEKTYQDLEKLIRCLEIYLDDCVGKIQVSCYSPNIANLEMIDAVSVLSFNYTEIPTDIYPSLKNVHHIHGCAKVDRPAEENDMVLGVNEYWDKDEKDSRTNFNLYKKFVQRIIKETGIGYKFELEKMSSRYQESEHLYSATNGYTGIRYTNVIIFGHSLDVTDGDILREVIRTEGVTTTIYYRNKQQQANQIANLSKVLGQDELLKRVFSTSPTIIFAQQEKMVPWQAT